jgi:carboxymethylenebutenolidase
LLRECGVDADAALALARQDAIGALYEANTRAAIEAGAFGSPTYRVGSEIYFGQDRLDFVHSALLDGAGD